MSHGFPISLYNGGMIETSIIYIGLQWEEGKYIPLATEACGIYEIVMGSYFMAIGGAAWIKDYRSGQITMDFMGCTSRIIVAFSKDLVIDGIFKVAHLPYVVAKCGYDLSAKGVNALRSNCKKNR